MKKDFRKKVIDLRNSQNIDFITINSTTIKDKLLKMNCIKNSNNIMLYLDFNNEVKTTDLINSLILDKKIISTPVTLKDERKLIPYQIQDLKNDIQVGAYGIKEPNPLSCSKINLSNIDLIIVPAVAYDKDCYRLGYGGGYYDRFLSGLRDDCIKIGVAFDLQIFDSIPKEPHDAQLDYIVTETQILTPIK